jgi:2-hydroxychromene-2-carboxylate isomerase
MVDQEDDSQDTCVRFARNLGMDAGIFEQPFSGGAIDEVVTSTAQHAIGQRVFGDLSLISDDHMLLGNDRLDLLGHYLSGSERD